MKFYTVTAKLKYPSAYDSGATFDIEAPTKAAAIKEARETVWREGLYDRLDGPLIYRAEVEA
tara:strand:- start:282 stop:467 length:186 start_codon:yes stop_codon:yes gene_type:complete